MINKNSMYYVIIVRKIKFSKNYNYILYYKDINTPTIIQRIANFLLAFILTSDYHFVVSSNFSKNQQRNFGERYRVCDVPQPLEGGAHALIKC